MANNKKAMDVSKPGKVAADASARPVIVSHRPIVQDPMVKPETEVSEFEPVQSDTTEPKSAPTSGEKVVEPINKDVVPESSEETKGDNTPSKVAEEIIDDPKPEVETKVESATPKTAEAESKPSPSSEQDVKSDAKKATSSSEAAEVDAIADQATSGKHKEKQDAEQEAAKQAHLQKLIDDKKYFVKTGQVARRRNNRIAVAFLVLLIILIGLYIAIDAKILKVGFDVPFQLIKN